VATAAGAAVVVVVDLVVVLVVVLWWGVPPEHAASTSPANPAAVRAPHPRRDRVDVACVRGRCMIGVFIVGDA
jgi:hypothetical protein